jgi:hypothetical protein
VKTLFILNDPPYGSEQLNASIAATTGGVLEMD